MKDLIIIGEQGSGKTLLGNWFDYLCINVGVHDGVSIEQIKEHCKTKLKKVRFADIYITNEPATYEQFDKDKFLIIKLTQL